MYDCVHVVLKIYLDCRYSRCVGSMWINVGNIWTAKTCSVCTAGTCSVWTAGTCCIWNAGAWSGGTAGRCKWLDSRDE